MHQGGKGALAGPAYEVLRTTKRSSEYLRRRWANGPANCSNMLCEITRSIRDSTITPAFADKIEGVFKPLFYLIFGHRDRKKMTEGAIWSQTH